MTTWFAVLELPFLLLATTFGFLASRALKSRVLGRGMTFIALGSLVMAVGHVIMIADQLLKEHILAALLGDVCGSWAWLVALCTSWLFYGLGFTGLYKVLPIRETELLLLIRKFERAEEVFCHFEDLYRILVESVRVVIYSLSPDGRVISLK